MARFGKNMKLIVDRAERDEVRVLLTEVLGCAPASPSPDLDLYKLEDGFQIGVFYRDAAEALAPAEQAKAAWLELVVADEIAVGKRLDALGVPRVEYVDKAHAYHKMPGGPVFRLARG